MIDLNAVASAIGVPGTTDEWQLRAALRAAFRRSLYITVKVGVCWSEPKNLMDAETFKTSCDWLQAVVTTLKRGLFEDPRGHMKTTRATRGIPIWYAIQRPHEEYDHPVEYERAVVFLAAHPHIRGVDGRLIVASDSKSRAARWVGSTQADWESNPILRWAFPENVWPSYTRLPYGEWTAESYFLPGRTRTTEPNPYLCAVGLDSKAQGGRAEGLLIDDLIGETSYRSPAEVERRRDWLKTIPYLLENRAASQPDGGFVIVIGNRWSLDDVNSLIHDSFSSWSIWRRSALRCLVHGAGNCGRWGSDEANACGPAPDTLWKGRYPTIESLASIVEESSPDAVAAQLYNDPTRTADLDPGRFVPFTVAARTIEQHGRQTREWCAVISPKDAPDEVIPLPALTAHLLSIDVASSRDPRAARTAVSWFAYDRPTDRVLWLDCRADRWAPDEAVSQAFALWKEVGDRARTTPRVLIEKVAAQAYFATALVNHARLAGYRMSDPDLVPPRQGFSKIDRIRQRVGYRLGQGLLLLRTGLPLPVAEVRRFPTGTLDTLDTAVQAEEIFLEMLGSRANTAEAAARRAHRRARIALAGRAGVLP